MARISADNKVIATGSGELTLEGLADTLREFWNRKVPGNAGLKVEKHVNGWAVIVRWDPEEKAEGEDG